MNNVRKYCLTDLQIIVRTQLTYDEHLKLIKFMCKDFGLIEISEYAKKTGNDKTIRNRIKSGKIPVKEISNTTFVIEKLIF